MKNIFYFLVVSFFIVGCAKENMTEQPPADTSIIEGGTPEDEETVWADELIIGGQIVTKKNGLAASTVSLLDTEQGALCTASLLSESVAVTAAHCIGSNTRSLILSFGRYSMGNVTRSIEDVAIAASWERHQNDRVNTGDLALIKFSGGLPRGFQAALLMDGRRRLMNGEKVTLAGFGVNDGDSHTGEGVLRTVDVAVANTKFSRTEVLLDQTQKKGACHGDSGGPAFVQDSKKGLLLWGVTSRGLNDPQDQCSGNAVYTRLQSYSRWINKTIKTWKERN